ncbi:hypothetical protein J6590_027730 [Homalodisca vitripennis]|nr:hypothetical protein J6590_027730 [Homalodisca vitripennis]
MDSLACAVSHQKRSPTPVITFTSNWNPLAGRLVPGCADSVGWDGVWGYLGSILDVVALARPVTAGCQRDASLPPPAAPGRGPARCPPTPPTAHRPLPPATCHSAPPCDTLALT